MKQCTYCFQEAKYGVEPDGETTMYLYLCPMDFAIHQEFFPESKFWKLDEIPHFLDNGGDPADLPRHKTTSNLPY